MKYCFSFMSYLTGREAESLILLVGSALLFAVIVPQLMRLLIIGT